MDGVSDEIGGGPSGSLPIRPTMLDPDSGVPLYVQIRDQLKHVIVSGHGDSVELSDSALADTFGVSKMTVRQALAELEQRDLIHRVHGKGTFLGPRPVEGQLNRLERFFEEFRTQGLTLDVELIERGRVSPTQEQGRLHGLNPDEKLGHFVRVRKVNGDPVCVDERYLPLEVDDKLADSDLETESTWLVLYKEFGVTIVKADLVVYAEAAGRREAKLLGLDEGAPLLCRGIEIMDWRDRCVISGTSKFRADSFVYRRTVAP